MTNILGPVTELLRGAHQCSRDSHAHFWSEICPIMPNHLRLNMLKTQILGALLVSYEPKTICPYLGISIKFDLFWPINWSNINIFE